MAEPTAADARSAATCAMTVFTPFGATASKVASPTPVSPAAMASQTPHIPSQLFDHTARLYGQVAKRGGVRGNPTQMGPILGWMLGAAVVTGSVFHFGRKARRIVDAVPEGEDPRTWKQKVTMVQKFFQHAMQSDSQLSIGIAKVHEDLKLEKTRVQIAENAAEDAKASEAAMAQKLQVSETAWGSIDNAAVEDIGDIAWKVLHDETQEKLEEADELEVQLRYELEGVWNKAEDALDPEKVLQEEHTLRSEISQLKHEVSRANRESSALMNSLVQAETDVQELKESLDIRTAELAQLSTKNEAHKQQLLEQQEATRTANMEVAELKERIATRDEELDRRDEAILAYDTRFKEAELEIETIKLDVTELEDAHRTTQASLAQETARRQEVEEQLKLEQLKSPKPTMARTPVYQNMFAVATNHLTELTSRPANTPRSIQLEKRTSIRDASPATPSSAGRSQDKISPPD